LRGRTEGVWADAGREKQAAALHGRRLGHDVPTEGQGGSTHSKDAQKGAPGRIR